MPIRTSFGQNCKPHDIAMMNYYRKNTEFVLLFELEKIIILRESVQPLRAIYKGSVDLRGEMQYVYR